jgi:hypothetical protein
MHEAGEDASAKTMYFLVMVCEVVAIAALWWLGRAFS